MVSRFVDDDPGYVAWLGEHPDSYVLNAERRPSRNFIVVHRSNCVTVAGAASAGGHTSTMVKVCAPTIAELDAWGREQVGGIPTRCQRCRP